MYAISGRSVIIFYFILKILSLIVPVLISMAYFTLLERKIIGSIQRRRGPTVVGFYGVMQPLADGLKLFLKESLMPVGSNKVLFYFAPVGMLGVSFMAWMVVPLGFDVSILDIGVNMLVLLAISSVGVYGIIFSGWSSNSRYAFLGSLRAAAQMISYEVSMGLIVMSLVIGKGSLNFLILVESQRNMWNILVLLPSFILFFISVLAETNRPPFDLPEAEAELVAGYNVEYSAMGFALFFLGECSNVILMSVVLCILSCGGWLGIYGVFFLKILFLLFVFVWVRAVVPRYRYDQLMRLGWKVFLPLSVGLLIMVNGVTVLFAI
jgi:NADH-quinone oxidoreductase subunit H